MAMAKHYRYMVEYDFPVKHIYFNSKLEAYQKAYVLNKFKYTVNVFKLIEHQIEYEELETTLNDSGFFND
jgi:hypothetical protein